MDRRLIGLAVMLLGPTAFAAEDAAQRGQRCAGIADSLERLVCYDAIFRTGPAAGAGQAVAPAASAAAPTAPPAAPARAGEAQAPDAVAGFGAEHLRRSVREADQETPRTLVAQVTEVRETRPNVYRMVLDNGQVWQQMDMDSRFDVKAGDTVEINRGLMGGYRMARQSRGGSGWVRVNRVK